MSIAGNCKQHLVDNQHVILEHGHKSTYVQNPHRFIMFQKKGEGDYSDLKHAPQILPVALPRT